MPGSERRHGDGNSAGRKEGRMSSVGEELPKEQARCRELIDAYRSIGPAGGFGAAMIERALQRADLAVMSGDVVAMVSAYEELRDIE